MSLFDEYEAKNPFLWCSLTQKRIVLKCQRVDQMNSNCNYLYHSWAFIETNSVVFLIIQAVFYYFRRLVTEMKVLTKLPLKSQKKNKSRNETTSLIKNVIDFWWLRNESYSKFFDSMTMIPHFSIYKQ